MTRAGAGGGAQVGDALRQNQTMQIVLSLGVLVCGTILVRMAAPAPDNRGRLRARGGECGYRR